MTRTVVVTGGNKGIGLAVARRFVAAGDDVLITGRDETALSAAADELRDLGSGGVETAAFDVTDEAAVTAALGDRPIDVLVNNAGVELSAPVHRTSREDWDRTLAINATGPFLATKAVLRGMRERDRGRIIVIASVAGLAGMRYTAAYAASKHAVVGFTRSLASELTGTGVTANAVCPAFVDTAMTDRSAAMISRSTGRSDADAREMLAGMQALGRLVTPEECAAAVWFLASDDAAAINGQTLALDGGGVRS